METLARNGADEVPQVTVVCVPEWALLFIISLEFFIHPHPVGGSQNGDTFLQCLL